MKNSPPRALFLLAILIASVYPSVSQAHQIFVFAAEEGDVIVGRVYYAGDVPAPEMEVEVTDGIGTMLGETVTDENGRFEFAPQHRVQHVFVVQTEDGHRATFAVDLPLHTPSIEDYVVPLGGEYFEIEMMERQLRKELEEIDRKKNQVRARDVIGGIGYIVGLMGLIAFWKSRSKRG